ncbi:MAG: hypothetical protein HFE74_04435 [Firmicutes bacterium]|nr:hypothetical protein [Bacillota bacterium]
MAKSKQELLNRWLEENKKSNNVDSEKAQQWRNRVNGDSYDENKAQRWKGRVSGDFSIEKPETGYKDSDSALGKLKSMEKSNSEIAKINMQLPEFNSRGDFNKKRETLSDDVQKSKDAVKEFKATNKVKSDITTEYNLLKDYEGRQALAKLTDYEMEVLDETIDGTANRNFFETAGYSNDEIEIMLDARERQKNAEEMYQKMQSAAEFADEHPILASIWSMPQKFVGGITGGVESFIQRMDDPYRTIDTNSAAFTLTNKANAARAKVSEDMSDTGKFLYNTGMSMGDSLLAIGVGGGAAKLGKVAELGNAVSLGSMSAQAGTDTVIDLTARGASADQALMGGLVAGTFEGLFEKVSLGNFNALKEVPTTSLKGFVKNTAKSMGVNASEEMATEAANILYDIGANGEFSNAEIRVKELMEEGMSEEEAKKTVSKELWGQIFEAGLSGGVMGVGFSGASTAIGNYKYAKKGKSYSEQEADAIRDYAQKSEGEANRLNSEESMKGLENTKLGMTADAAKMDIYNSLKDAQSIEELQQSYRTVTSDLGSDSLRDVADSVYDIKVRELSRFNGLNKAENTLESDKNTTDGQFAEQLEKSRKTANIALKEETEKLRGATTKSGDKVIVIEPVEVNGEQMYKTASGETINPTEVTFDNANTKKLFESASKIEGYSEKADFINNYDGNTTVENYKSAWDAFKLRGKFGKNISFNEALELNSGYIGSEYISKNAARVAFFTGANEIGTGTQESPLTTIRTSGEYKNNASDVNEGLSELLSAVAEKTGLSVELRDRIMADNKEANGSFRPSLARMVISANADNAFQATGHELVHFESAYAPEGYKALQDAVIGSELKNGYIKGANEQIEGKMKSFNMSREAATEEYIADFIGGILSSEESARDFIEFVMNDKATTMSEKKGILESVIDFINKILDNLKAFIKNDSHISDVAKHAAEQNYEDIKDILKLFEATLDEASANLKGEEKAKSNTTLYSTDYENIKKKPISLVNAQALTQTFETQGTSVSNISISNDNQKSNVKFSVKESFAEQVDKTLSGNLNPKNSVYVCETPAKLKQVGLSSLPMLMTQRHIRNINSNIKNKNKNAHGINAETIKKLPEFLANPVMIMDSLSTATSNGVVVVTNEVDNENRPIIVSIKPNGKGYYFAELDTNFITSMYGRNEFSNFIENCVDEEAFLFIDSKKSQELLARIQLQLPQRLKAFDFDTIIRKSNNVVNDATKIKDVTKDTLDSYGQNPQTQFLRTSSTNSISNDNQKSNVKFSLKNKNIDKDTKIPYVVSNDYINVPKNDMSALKSLQEKVKQLPRGTYENKATGYKADINRVTIGKILNPTNNVRYDQWSKKYINNLNSALSLPQLFENAIYVDTVENQKRKNENKQIKGFHHFIAPFYMNGKDYRVRIVAREKENSDTLYIVDTKVLPIKDGVRMAAGQKPPTLGATPSKISIPDLIRDVKIYNYDTQVEQSYSPEDIKFSLKENIDITYENLISKPDMSISKITITIEDIIGKSRKEIVNEAKERLHQLIPKNERGVISIRNDDTGMDVVIGKPGLEHGLDRNYEYTAMVLMNLDSYIKNAIKINEAIPDIKRKHSSDILLGYGETESGDQIPAYFVVSKLMTGQTELIEFGSLYSVRAKKIVEDSAHGSPGVQSRTSTTISISKLLDIVNEEYSDILPKSVAEHYGNKKKISKLGNSVKFSIKEDFNTKFEAWDKETIGFSFVVGRTSEALRSIGVPDKQIRWDASKIKNIKANHKSITDEIIKAVPNIIEYPVLVLESRTVEGRLVCIGEVNTNSGKPVIVVLELNPSRNGRKIDLIKIASTYGKDGIQNLIEKSKILYVDPNKERTDNWLKVNRLQLPLLSTQYGSIDSISDTVEKINKFSIKESSLPIQKLEKENEKLKAVNKSLREQMRLTKGVRLKDSDIQRISRKLLKEHNSTYAGLFGDLKKYYEYIANSETLDSEQIYTIAGNIGHEILEYSNKKSELTAEAKEILSDIKDSRITLSDVQKDEAAYHYGSYGSYRGSLFGKTNIVNDGLNLDTKWQEWSEMYPEIFDSNVAEADQPVVLADIVTTLGESYIDENGFGIDEAALMVGYQIYEEYFNVPEVKSYADKQKQKYDKLRSESSQKLREYKAESRAKYQEALKEARKANTRANRANNKADKLTKEIAQIKAKNRQTRAERLEYQNVVKLRGQVKKTVKKLNKLFISDNNDNHVPEKMKKAVSDFMLPFLNDTSVFNSASVLRLGNIYRKVNTSEEYIEFSQAYDESLVEDLELLEEILNGRRLSQLNSEELGTLSLIMDNLYRMVKQSNELIINGRKESLREFGREAFDEASRESVIERLGLPKNVQNMYDQVKTLVVNSNITPGYFFKRLGSKWNSLYEDLLDGQDRWVNIVYSGQEKYQEFAKKYNYYEWDSKKLNEVSIGGVKKQLTLEQMMLLYATGQRELRCGQDSMHMFEGGVVFRDVVKEKPLEVNGKKVRGVKVQYVDKNVTPLAFTLEEYETMCKMLTEEQIEFVDSCVEFLSNDMAAYGNEVSMELYGIRKFTEDYYIPFNVDPNFIHSRQGEIGKIDNNIKNAGMTKKTVKGANNAIIIDGFSDVWAAHINQMALYNGFAIPLDNMNKVLNYVERNDDDKSKKSMKTALTNAYSSDAVNYIQTFIRDMNGGISATKEDSLMKSMLSRFKKGATYFSASVVVQQPTAILRGMAVVDPKYFVNTDKINYNELMKYAPIAKVKQMGRFDTMIGRTAQEFILQRKYDNKGEWLSGVVKDKDFKAVDDLLGAMPQKADEIGWGILWNAVKRETADKTGLTGEALLRKAGLRFREVANLTQVYDSTLSKSQFMRNKSAYASMVTAFGAEPTVSFNMYLDAMIEGNKLRKSGKKMAAFKYAKRSIIAVIASQFAASFFKAFVTAARDDDDEKTYWEKFIAKGWTGGIDDINPLRMIPVARDLMSVADGYDVDRTDISVFSDLMNAIDNFNNSSKPIEDRIWQLAGAFGNVTGIPVRNAYRDFKAIQNVITSPVSAETSSLGIKIAIAEESGKGYTYKGVAEDLYKAIDNTDEQIAIAEELDEYYRYKVERGKDKDKLKSTIKSQITQYYKELYINSTNSEKMKIQRMLLRLRLNGKQLYSADDFKRWIKDC